MSLISNLLSGRIADSSGLKKMPLVFMVQFIVLALLPVFLLNKLIGIFTIMILELTMYINNSPIQLYFMDIAEHEYPQSMVLASSFNSIFSNIGIAIGSASGSLAFDNLGINGVGSIGAVYALLAGIVSYVLLKPDKNTDEL